MKEQKRNARQMKNQVGELSNDNEEQMEQELQETKVECKRLEGELELKEDECAEKSECADYLEEEVGKAFYKNRKLKKWVRALKIRFNVMLSDSENSESDYYEESEESVIGKFLTEKKVRFKEWR